MFIWKKVFAFSCVPKTALIVLELLTPVQEVIVIVLGSAIVHVNDPLGIDVVTGTMIWKYPFAGTAVITVENRARVVRALTVVSELWTPTLCKVADWAIRIQLNTMIPRIIHL
jgi:hypothetical protein